MVKKNDTFLKKLRETFILEADEHLKAISSGLLNLEKSTVDADRKQAIESIFREVHSLKGAARSVDRPDIENICRPLESLFAALKKDELLLNTDLFDLLHQTLTGIESILSPVADQHLTQQQPPVELLVKRLEGALTGAGDREPAVAGPAVAPDAEQRMQAPETVRVPVARLDKLFRQVEEMISVKLTADQRMTELHEISELFDDLTRQGQRLRSHLTGLLPAVTDRTVSSGSKEMIDTSKWHEDLDNEKTLARILTSKLVNLAAALQADRRMLGKMIDHLMEEAKQMLMMPAAGMFEIVPVIVRDLAREQGKEVDVEISGSDIELDRRIQEEMKDPLLHIIRNCVDHGIETPEQRKQKQKPARGKITVSIARLDSGRAEIVICDDGAGILYDKVLAAAQRSGMISPDEAAQLDADAIASLIFFSGISTSPILTDISGRGLGLAIAREKIENLNGNISLESQPDGGTIFRIVLPVTLSAFRGVEVRAGDRYFVLPSLNVELVTRVKPDDIRTVENREMIKLNGNALSLVRLAEVLGLPQAPAAEQSPGLKHLVVLLSGSERMAFLVDEILGEQEILLKDLGGQLLRVRNIAGTTASGAGELVPVLNIADLMKTATAATGISRDETGQQPTADQETFILVVEDSITARALLKNILEAAGYRVKTAVDGVDALTSLKTEPIDLVVSDVEMPRMDGFTLTAKIRADKHLADLPVVLVTALESREHRERGIEAGANAYILKSGFDETGLLETINRLILPK